MADIDNAVLEARLEGLEKTLRDGLARIETNMLSIDNRLRILETSTAKDVAIQGQRVMELELKVGGHDETLKSHTEFITKLKPLTAAITWVSVTVGALIIALIWAILTHNIQLIP